MKKYLKLLRVTHYMKNGLIFLPLIFSRGLFNTNLSFIIFGFIAFCSASSIVYIINDINDVQRDRLHPVKKNRPIASGTISVHKATLILVMLMVSALLFSYLASGIDYKVFGILALYVLINLAYSYGLKNVVLVDILLLVAGFTLRVYYGASIIDVNVSNWLYLTVMSAAFFFAFGKRRNEIIKVKTDTRKVLNAYSKEFLDKNMYLCLTLSIAFYSLWAISQEVRYLAITIPIMMTILMKYTLTLEGDSHGDPTEMLLKDRVLQFLVVLFGILIVYLMI